MSRKIEIDVVAPATLGRIAPFQDPQTLRDMSDGRIFFQSRVKKSTPCPLWWAARAAGARQQVTACYITDSFSTPRMNIDLLPFSAFDPKSSCAASRPIGEGPTLTLRLDLGPIHPAFDAMSGSASVDEFSCLRVVGLHAGVVPVEDVALTITF